MKQKRITPKNQIPRTKNTHAKKQQAQPQPARTFRPLKIIGWTLFVSLLPFVVIKGGLDWRQITIGALIGYWVSLRYTSFMINIYRAKFRQMKGAK